MIYGAISQIELAATLKDFRGNIWSKSRPCFIPDTKTYELASIVAKLRKLSESDPRAYPTYELTSKGERWMLYQEYKELLASDPAKVEGFSEKPQTKSIKYLEILLKANRDKNVNSKK